jgi:OOP family OmpA-OmpF porin
VDIITAIKNTILIFSLTFSFAQADEPGYVLQNGSGVTDSSKQCVRTAASNSESVPAECSNAPKAVALDGEPSSDETFDGCVNIQCAPAISTDGQTQGSNELISAEIPFMFDRSDLTPQATGKLDSFISAIRQRVSNIISIFGHTDSLGTDPYNDALSERRANRVRDYLLDSGIPGREISVKGMGEGSPVADNNTRSGRAKNRRVVIEAK